MLYLGFLLMTLHVFSHLLLTTLWDSTYLSFVSEEVETKGFQ